VAISPEVSGFTTIEDLEEQLNEVYVPSRAIPSKTKDRLWYNLFRILDWFSFIGSKASFRLWDLADVEAAPRDALIAMILEFDLPVPDFATDAQVRELARQCGSINKFRNTIRGWELYLDSISPEGVEVTLSINRFTARRFTWGFPGYMFPNEAIMGTWQTPGDTVAYLWSPEMLFVTFVVTVRGDVLPDEFKDFVRETPRWFIPLFIANELVNIVFIFEEF